MQAGKQGAQKCTLVDNWGGSSHEELVRSQGSESGEGASLAENVGVNVMRSHWDCRGRADMTEIEEIKNRDVLSTRKDSGW